MLIQRENLKNNLYFFSNVKCNKNRMGFVFIMLIGHKGENNKNQKRIFVTEKEATVVIATESLRSDFFLNLNVNVKHFNIMSVNGM